MEKHHRLKIVALARSEHLSLANHKRGNADTALPWAAGTFSDPRWPSGWWILPCAVGGLFETVALVLWLSGHL